MSNKLNRYRAIYEKTVRPNNASVFPRNVFKRAPNHRSSVYDRVGNRVNCFEATLVHLTQRFDGKEVFLIGTMNQSTMLAKRTEMLINEIKPDAVFVQANQDWFERAKLLKFVDSQEEFNNYKGGFQGTEDSKWIEYYWNSRKLLFLTRLWIYGTLFRFHFRFTPEFQFLYPGLETKFACEAAEKVGAELKFLGPELDDNTWQRLLHETRMNLPHYIIKRCQYQSSFWTQETADNRQLLGNLGARAFTEQAMDQYMMNWYISSAELFFPKIKSIFVDRKDEDIFKEIDRTEHKRIVLVVNQWHMEGLEHHWCHRYGQVPRSMHFTSPINPIGDMNLRDGLFQRLYNGLHREIASSNAKSTPSTYADWITGYNRESNWQYEHRDM